MKLTRHHSQEARQAAEAPAVDQGEVRTTSSEATAMDIALPVVAYEPVGLVEDLLAPLRQIDTPEFKVWFGDSKVVDEVGDPLRVYHGTNTNAIEVFKAGNIKSLGIHVGSEAQAAKMGAIRMSLYVSMQNPLRLMDGHDWRPRTVLRQLQALGIELPFEPKTANQFRKGLEALGYDGIVYLNRYEGLPPSDAWGMADHDYKYGPRAMTDTQFRQRFPMAMDSWIIFRPQQIKSATANCGAFDPVTPDIRG